MLQYNFNLEMRIIRVRSLGIRELAIISPYSETLDCIQSQEEELLFALKNLCNDHKIP